MRRSQEGNRAIAIGRFARKGRFEIFAPLFRNRHIANGKVRVRIARYAGKHQALYVKMIEGELGGHGRIDHADPAHEDHDLFALNLAGYKPTAVDLAACGAFDQSLQLLALGRKGADKGGPWNRIAAGEGGSRPEKGQGQGKTRPHQAEARKAKRKPNKTARPTSIQSARRRRPVTSLSAAKLITPPARPLAME